MIRSALAVVLACAFAFASGGCEDGAPARPEPGPRDVDPSLTPEILVFEATPDQLLPHQRTTLRWEVNHARLIEISTEDGATLASTFDWVGAVDTPPLRRPITYVLRAANGEKIATRTLTVEVFWEEPELLATLIQGAATRPQPLSGTIVWVVENTDMMRVEVDGALIYEREVSYIQEGLPAQESTTFPVTPATNRMVLEASSSGGVVRRELTVPVVDHFWVRPRVFFVPGQPATVEWRTRNARSVQMYHNGGVAAGFSGGAEGRITTALMGVGGFVVTADGESASLTLYLNVVAPQLDLEPSNDTPSGANDIWAGASARIEPAGDVDYWAFRPIRSGSHLMYTLGPNGVGCELDTQITVRDERGSNLGYAQDGGEAAPGGGACARLELSAEVIDPIFLRGGAMWIEIRGNGINTGDYTMVLEDL